MTRPLLIAHRGASYEAPENTLASVRLAKEAACDYIEVDVQLTKDGVPVLFHDETLLRLCNLPRYLSECTWQELQQYDVGSWFSREFAGSKIPSLEEALATEGVGWTLELKSYPSTSAQLIPQVLALLERVSPKAPVLLSSFSLSYLKELFPSSYPVLGVAETLEELEQCRSLGIHHLCLEERLLEPHRIAFLKGEGHLLWAWTIDKPQRACPLVRRGIDGIITNHPRLLAEHYRETLCKSSP